MTTTKRVRLVVAAHAVLGEGPVWHVDEQALYWLDIKGKRAHRYDPGTGEARSWTLPFRLGSLAPRVGGGFVGGGDRGLVAFDRDFTRFDVIASPEAHLPGNRFNDGKTDRAGRFWAGTMDDAEEQATGSLYRFASDGSWVQADDGYQVTNGPAFSADGATMFHTDSADQTIYRFDLDHASEPSGKRVFARFNDSHGYPDGMTVDAEGCLWVAFWDGWCLRRLSPEGEVIDTVAMPVQRPTSCAFGGADLAQLFVTSATVGLDDQALAAQPGAGGLFVVDAGVRGLAAAAFDG